MLTLSEQLREVGQTTWIMFKQRPYCMMPGVVPYLLICDRPTLRRWVNEAWREYYDDVAR